MALTFAPGTRVVMLDTEDVVGLHAAKTTGTVVAAPAGTVLYWNLVTGRRLTVPIHHPGPIRGMVAVAWDDGRRVEWEIVFRLRRIHEPRARDHPTTAPA